jgi:hypothetical protein
MYALITNGVVAKYPYSIEQLRADNRNVSFPQVLTDDVLSQFGVVTVATQPQPDYDLRTQRIETATFPTLIDGVWTVAKTVVNKTQEQIDADTANKAIEVRRKRNDLLSGSDWTQVLDSPVDRTAWATYRDELRQVPEQTDFPWNITWPNKPE